MSVEFGNPKLADERLYEIYEQNKSEKKYLLSAAQKERDFLKSAENDGLIQCLDESEVIRSSRNENDDNPEKASDASIIYATYKRLKDISIVEICARLVVAILNNNFIKNINPFKSCANIRYLDLHSNLINHLPGGEFWWCLENLAVLYLHDNGLSKLEELRQLSRSPSLCCLTLYDTPLSLKKTYRHCAVNAILSLKSLDCFVVSDEEIIEDANFASRFKPLQPQLFHKFNIEISRKASCPSFTQSLRIIRRELATINRIQSKYSPVLVLQKWIRGHLVRLRYNYIMETRLWAAVSIQRFYRSRKGCPIPPPVSPSMIEQESFLKSFSSMKLDYETYLKLRRSRHKSSQSIRSDEFFDYRQSSINSKGSIAFRTNLGIRNISEVNSGIEYININMEKLRKRSNDLLNEDKSFSSPSPTIWKKIPNTGRSLIFSPKLVPVPSTSTITEQFSINTDKIIANVFNDWDKMRITSENDELNDIDRKEDFDFRLSIRKPHIMVRDPLEEIIIRKMEGAEDIRKSIKQIEARIKSVPIRKINKKRKSLTADEKLYYKTQGTMGLSCFYAVEKAYKDRDRAEDLMRRMDLCNHYKEIERKANEKIKRYKQNVIKATIKKKNDDRLEVMKALAAKRDLQDQLVDETSKKRELFRQENLLAKNAYKFAQEFGCKNATISKALLRHDHGMKNEERLNFKKKFVDDLKTEDEDHKLIVKDYLEQMKLNRQTERMNCKSDINFMLNRNAAKKQSSLKALYEKRKLKQKQDTSVPVGKYDVADHFLSYYYY